MSVRVNDGPRCLFLSLLKAHHNRNENGNEIKIFSNEQKLVEFITYRSVLKVAQKRVFKKENYPG